MPTVLAGLSRLDPERIRHVASPLIELGCALHVLAEPRHHGRVEWAAAVRMPAVLRSELSQWTWTVRAVRARFFATTAATGVPSWEDELRALRARSPAELAAELVRPLRGRPLSSRTTDTDAVLHWARSRGRSVAGLLAHGNHRGADDRLLVTRAVVLGSWALVPGPFFVLGPSSCGVAFAAASDEGRGLKTGWTKDGPRTVNKEPGTPR